MQNNSTIVRRFIEGTINQGQLDSAVRLAWEAGPACVLAEDLGVLFHRLFAFFLPSMA